MKGIKKFADILVSLMLRLALGIAGIYLINIILSTQEIQSGVGLNGLTIGLVGLLGLPGFLLIYGTSFYFHFH